MSNDNIIFEAQQTLNCVNIYSRVHKNNLKESALINLYNILQSNGLNEKENNYLFGYALLYVCNRHPGKAKPIRSDNNRSKSV